MAKIPFFGGKRSGFAERFMISKRKNGIILTEYPE
jgi:hypothetical protein